VKIVHRIAVNFHVFCLHDSLAGKKLPLD